MQSNARKWFPRSVRFVKYSPTFFFTIQALSKKLKCRAKTRRTLKIKVGIKHTEYFKVIKAIIDVLDSRELSRQPKNASQDFIYLSFAWLRCWLWCTFRKTTLKWINVLVLISQSNSFCWIVMTLTSALGCSVWASFCLSCKRRLSDWKQIWGTGGLTPARWI